MNIRTTAYDETGTLFNFDIIVKSNEDFEKVMKVLRTFYEIKSQALEAEGK